MDFVIGNVGLKVKESSKLTAIWINIGERSNRGWRNKYYK